MMQTNKNMKKATLLLSGFAISPIAATGDFFPLPFDELPYNDDRGQDATVNCPLSCWNGAKCIATGAVGSGFQTNTEWSCECPAGFHGDLCEQQDNDDGNLCGEDSCKHGSECVQIGETGHMCDCTPAYTDDTFYAGRFCEFPSTIFCTEENHQEGRQFCVNEGKCGALDHAPCSCPKGFAGPRCATRVADGSTAYSECSIECSNDGTCHKGEKGMESYGKFAVDVSHLIQETHINFEHCVCPLGYFGIKCEYEFEDCGQEGEHMCLNGGACEVASDGSHRCACMAGFYGDGCEFEILRTEHTSQHNHSILGIIGYGLCAVFAVVIATVACERTKGKTVALKPNVSSTVVVFKKAMERKAMTDSITPAEANLEIKEKVPFFKFVLTGGPCAGKTTALARIYSYLRERGFEVITCPECFTILASNGLSLDFFGVDGMDTIIQSGVVDVQISMEESLENTLRAFGKPAVLLCDRGPMDGAAYLSEEKWNKILKERGVNVTDLRDRRYNAVLHMVTAADGAEAFYTLENNAVRSEDAATAIALDRKTQKAWSGHAHHYVFDNSTDFEGKLQRIVDRISKLVGLPSNLSRRSAKFLLKTIPDPKSFPKDVVYHSFAVEKVYLVDQDADEKAYSFLRKRTTIDRDGKLMGSVYQITTVQQTADGETVEQKRIINAREYNTAYRSRDTSRHIIVQKRISFLYKLQSFTIHQYEKPSHGLCFLHAQVETGTDSARETKCKVELPPFLDIDRRLMGTGDEQKYGAYGLSLINK